MAWLPLSPPTAASYAGFARAEFAPGDPREADVNTEPWKSWNEHPGNHFRDRVAGERDDEPRRGGHWPVFR